ncbi:hypothetical protein D9M69_693890 [compost metagenome]
MLFWRSLINRPVKSIGRTIIRPPATISARMSQALRAVCGQPPLGTAAMCQEPPGSRTVISTGACSKILAFP